VTAGAHVYRKAVELGVGREVAVWRAAAIVSWRAAAGAGCNPAGGTGVSPAASRPAGGWERGVIFAERQQSAKTDVCG